MLSNDTAAKRMSPTTPGPPATWEAPLQGVPPPVCALKKAHGSPQRGPGGSPCGVCLANQPPSHHVLPSGCRQTFWRASRTPSRGDRRPGEAASQTDASHALVSYPPQPSARPQYLHLHRCGVDLAAGPWSPSLVRSKVRHTLSTSSKLPRSPSIFRLSGQVGRLIPSCRPHTNKVCHLFSTAIPPFHHRGLLLLLLSPRRGVGDPSLTLHRPTGQATLPNQNRGKYPQRPSRCSQRAPINQQTFNFSAANCWPRTCGW